MEKKILLTYVGRRNDYYPTRRPERLCETTDKNEGESMSKTIFTSSRKEVL